ncbi:MAG: hypothetical protein IJZ08_03580 [Clostridia bacterium]|nr:hypothetical protein [Clostridia bacterium]
MHKTDERERLTKDSLRAELEKARKRSVFESFLALFAILIYLLLPYLCIRLLLKTMHSAPWVFIAGDVLFGAAALCAVGITVRTLLPSRKQRKALENGAFSIREDRLVSVNERTIKSIRRHYSCQIVFSFESGRQYRIHETALRGTRLESTIDFSSPGDPFYLVSYDAQPDAVEMIYPAKIYRLENAN